MLSRNLPDHLLKIEVQGIVAWLDLNTSDVCIIVGTRREIKTKFRACLAGENVFDITSEFAFFVKEAIDKELEYV